MNELEDLKKRNENLIHLLERIKPIIPTYYSELIDEIDEILKNNKN